MNLQKLNECFDKKYNLTFTEAIDLKNLFNSNLINSESDRDSVYDEIKMVFKSSEDEDQFKQVLVDYINANLYEDEQYMPEEIQLIEFIANISSELDYDHGESNSYSWTEFESLDYGDDIIDDDQIIRDLFKQAFNIDESDIDRMLKDAADEAINKARTDALPFESLNHQNRNKIVETRTKSAVNWADIRKTLNIEKLDEFNKKLNDAVESKRLGFWSYRRRYKDNWLSFMYQSLTGNDLRDRIKNALKEIKSELPEISKVGIAYCNSEGTMIYINVPYSVFRKNEELEDMID